MQYSRCCWFPPYWSDRLKKAKRRFFYTKITWPSCMLLFEPWSIITENLPDTRPLQTDTTHVIIRDLNYFLQAKHPRLLRMSQFFQRDLQSKRITHQVQFIQKCAEGIEYLTQSADEIDDSVAIQTCRSSKDAIYGDYNALRYCFSNRFFDTRCNNQNEWINCNRVQLKVKLRSSELMLTLGKSERCKLVAPLDPKPGKFKFKFMAPRFKFKLWPWNENRKRERERERKRERQRDKRRLHAQRNSTKTSKSHFKS